MNAWIAALHKRIDAAIQVGEPDGTLPISHIYGAPIPGARRIQKMFVKISMFMFEQSE